jgi:hypothetical protein
VKPSEFRLTCAAGVLVLFLAGMTGLALIGSGKAIAPAAGGSPAKEPSLLTETQTKTYWFFAQGDTGAGAGPGLFETDFFKPAPAPKPAPKPAPPATRNVALIYRGLAGFPDGSRVAYLAVEGRTLNPAPGDEVADGWKLLSFDSEQAVLAKGDARIMLPFNRSTALTVPVKP